MSDFGYNLQHILWMWYYSYQRKAKEEDITFFTRLTGLPEDKVRAGFRDAFQSFSRIVQQPDTESLVDLAFAKRDTVALLPVPVSPNHHVAARVPLRSNDPQPHIQPNPGIANPSLATKAGAVFYANPDGTHPRGSTGSIDSLQCARGYDGSDRSSLQSQSDYRSSIFSSPRTSLSSGTRCSTNSLDFPSLQTSERSLIESSPSCSSPWDINIRHMPAYLEQSNESPETLLDCEPANFQFFPCQARIDKDSQNPEPKQLPHLPRGRLSRGRLRNMPMKSAKHAPACRDMSATSATSSPMTEGLLGRYLCTFCEVRFPRKSDWNRHEQEQHEQREYWICMANNPTRIEADWKCTLCPTVKPTFEDIADHLKHKHATAECARKTPEERHRFGRKNHLKQHLVRRHKLAEGTSDWEAWSVPVSPAKTAWACGYCSKLLSTWSNRIEHIATEHYENDEKVCDVLLWDPSKVILGLLQRELIKKALKSKIKPKERHLVPDLQWTKETAETLRYSLESFDGEIEQATELVEQVLQRSSNAHCILTQTPDSSPAGTTPMQHQEEDTINHEIPSSETPPGWCHIAPHLLQQSLNPLNTDVHPSSFSVDLSSNNCDRMSIVFDTSSINEGDEYDSTIIDEYMNM